MKILALEKDVPGVTNQEFTNEILGVQARKAWDLFYQSNILHELYFTADTHKAVLMLECESADQARQRLAELPLMRAGLIDFQIIPLVASSGSARARLFGQK